MEFNQLFLSLVAQALIAQGLFVCKVVSDEDTAPKLGTVPTVDRANILAQLP
jgi:hypothetical protein